MDWKGLVKTIAPTIGTALGGPLVGTAVSALSEAVLGDSKGTEKDVSKAIVSASPEVLISIQKAEIAFKQRMEELDIDVFKLEVEDRKSARQLFQINKWPQIVLSTIFLLAYFSVLGIFLVGDVNIESGFKDVIILLLGLMVREVPTIMGFWFGSSLGSKEKDAQIASKNEQLSEKDIF